MKVLVIFIMIIGLGFPIASAQYILELPPLKQFNADVPFDKIHCKDGLVLIQKYDGTPACVKPETVPKIFERNWLPSQKLWNEVKRQDVFPNSEEFSQIVRTKTDTVQEASELVDFNIMTPSYLPPNYEIKSVIVLSSDAVMGFAGIEEITEKTNPSDYLWNGGMMFYQTHIPTANERFTDLQDRLEHITTPYVLGNASAFVNWHYIKYDGNELISMMPTLWTVKDDTYTTINGNVSEQHLVAMAGSMHGCFSDCVTESTKTKLVERGWTTKDSSAQKIIERIKQDAQAVNEVDARYVETLALMNQTVSNFVYGVEWTSHCCGYSKNNNSSEITITFLDSDNQKQLGVTFDLDTMQITDIQQNNTVSIGKGLSSEPDPYRLIALREFPNESSYYHKINNISEIPYISKINENKTTITTSEQFNELLEWFPQKCLENNSDSYDCSNTPPIFEYDSTKYLIVSHGLDSNEVYCESGLLHITNYEKEFPDRKLEDFIPVKCVIPSTKDQLFDK